MITPEDIDRLEEELQTCRRQGGGAVSIGFPIKPTSRKVLPITVMQTRRINGTEATLIAVPTKLIQLDRFPSVICASAMRIELRRSDCLTQCRIVGFQNPVIIEAEKDRIFIKLPPPNQRKGRQRFQHPQSEWLVFDLFLLFDGDKPTKNLLKSLGVRRGSK